MNESLMNDRLVEWLTEDNVPKAIQLLSDQVFYSGLMWICLGTILLIVGPFLARIKHPLTGAPLTESSASFTLWTVWTFGVFMILNNVTKVISPHLYLFSSIVN